MPERLSALGRSLVSIVALALILLGPPLALVRFIGNPLPSSVPGLAEITDALTRTGIDDRAVVKFLAVLAWIVWLQIAAAIGAQIAGELRNRPAPSLPVLPGFQGAARHLVAGVALVAVIAGSTRTPATAAPFPAPPSADFVDADVRPVSDPPVDARTSEAPPEPAGIPTTGYVVQRHDSLWSIAETVLGDGFRWREVRDLNIGRPQPDGGALTASTDVIRPGWVLTVPVQAKEAHPPSTTHQVQPGEHLWKIAEDALEASLQREAADGEIDPYWRDLIELNRSTLPDPGNPNLLHGGETLRLPDPLGTGPGRNDPHGEQNAPPAPPAEPTPPDPAPSLTAPSPTEAPAPTAPKTSAPTTIAQGAPVPAHNERADEDGNAEEISDGNDDVDVIPGVLGIAATGLAAAVAARVLRRRRDRQARATPGNVVPPTPDELVDTHREVVGHGDTNQTTEVRAALAEAATHVASRRRGRCRPRLIQVDANRIDVFLEDPDVDPPPGWVVEASGQVWARSRGEMSDASYADVAPLLATLGRPDQDTELLYDVETAGCTVLSGDAEPVEDLLRSVLREIVHRNGETVVVAVGDLPTPSDPAVRHVDTWDEIADEALGWAQLSAGALAAHKLDSAFLARGSGRSVDGTVPMLIVCDGAPEDNRFQELVQLAVNGAAVAILVATDRPGGPGTQVILTDGRLEIPALGLELEPQAIDADVASDIDALVEAADAPAQPPAHEPQTTPSPLDPSSNGQPYEDPGYEVLIRVLGQIEAEGGREALKPKQLGLLTYIATHPGCSAEQVEEALWPGPTSSRRHRLHITLSQIRSSIGSHHLPPFEDTGSYRVLETVRTDLDLFERRVKYADGKPAGEAATILRGALDLVTGPPFTYNARGRQSFSWVDTEHWISMTEAAIVKTSWDLWQIYTDAGDCDGAIWAAQRGLLASPTNTELTNCLLKAYAARGDLGAAERVYRSHLRALDHLDLGDPEDSTIELWEEVSEQSPAASP